MSTKCRMLTNWNRGISRVGPAAAVLLAAGLWLAVGREARAAGLLIADGGLGGCSTSTSTPCGSRSTTASRSRK